MGFRTRPDQPGISMVPGSVCPLASNETEDRWGDFQDFSPITKFLARKCNTKEVDLSRILEDFWEEVIQVPMPRPGVVHYAQGARFAVSRQRIRQRSKAYYQKMLEAV